MSRDATSRYCSSIPTIRTWRACTVEPPPRARSTARRCDARYRRSCAVGSASATAAASKTVRAFVAVYPAFALADDRCRVFVKPLVHGEQLRGVLLATFESGAVTADAELDSLRELANRIAVATSAAEREQQLFRRAHFDALTGLPNRQLCHDRLGQALAVARRQEQKLAVLFIDLDGFKHVNDSLGHPAGDQLLRETSVRLRSAVRATRYGRKTRRRRVCRHPAERARAARG